MYIYIYTYVLGSTWFTVAGWFALPIHSQGQALKFFLDFEGDFHNTSGWLWLVADDP